ncbi:MAG: FAD binding domain-containing protein, partial [Fidelibacterota bacterium]
MNRRNYFIPNTLDDAVRLVKEQREDFIFFAGGTDIQLHIKQKLIQPVTVIDLSKIESMKQIRISKKKLEIGGLAVLDDLIKNPQIREKYPI